MNDDLSLTRYEKLCMEFQESGKSADIIDLPINTDSLLECYGRFWMRLNSIMNSFIVENQFPYEYKYNIYTSLEIAAFFEACCVNSASRFEFAQSTEEPYYMFTVADRFVVSVYPEFIKNNEFNLVLSEWGHVDSPFKYRFIKVTDLVESAKQIGWQSAYAKL